MTGRGARIRWLWFAALVASWLLVAPVAGAQEADEEGEKRRGWGREERPDPELANRPQMSAKTKERHDRAMADIFDERWDEAERELGKIFLRRLNRVEKAKIHRAYGFIANGRGDREEARRRFAAAIDSGGFLPPEAADLRFKIALFYMQDENWAEAAKTIEQWFRETPTPPNARSYYLLALNYYQLDQFDKALEPAEQAVEMSAAPDENSLQLLLGLHLLAKRYEQAIPVLEALVSRYPKKGYWLSLSTVHGALGSYEEALVPLQLAYLQGELGEGEDVQRLAQLELFIGLPYRAAKALAAGLESGGVDPSVETLAMLSNSWIAAREYEASIEPLERAAALSPDGELYVRLAQVHVQRESWAAAADALEKALGKGDLEAPGDAHLLMGIVVYSQEQPQRARHWFQNASRFEPTRDEARNWIKHIDEELLAAQASSEAQAEAQGG